MDHFAALDSSNLFAKTQVSTELSVSDSFGVDFVFFFIVTGIRVSLLDMISIMVLARVY